MTPSMFPLDFIGKTCLFHTAKGTSGTCGTSFWVLLVLVVLVLVLLAHHPHPSHMVSSKIEPSKIHQNKEFIFFQKP